MNLLKIFISIVLLYWLIDQYGGSAIESLSRLQSIESVILLLLAIIFSISDKLLRVWNLKLMLDRSKINITYPRLVQISFVSMFFGLFFPGGAGPDIVRVVQLKKYSQGLTKPASATIWMNIATILAAGMLAMFGAGISMIMELRFDRDFMKLVILFSLILMLGLFLVLNNKSQKFVRYIIENTLLNSKRGLHRLAVKFLDALSSHAELWVFSRATMVSSAVLVLAVIRTYFLSEALVLNVEFIYYLIVLPLVLYVTIIPVSFAGVGVREYSFVYFLGMIGIDAGDAFMLGLMITLLNTLLSLIGGIVYLCSRGALELNSTIKGTSKN